MKRGSMVWWWCLGLLAGVTLIAVPPGRDARGEGPADRALTRRAGDVTRMKNELVRGALGEKGIACRTDARGAIVQVRIGGVWEAVERVEVVPVIVPGAPPPGLGHEISLVTPQAVYRIVTARPGR